MVVFRGVTTVNNVVTADDQISREHSIDLTRPADD